MQAGLGKIDKPSDIVVPERKLPQQFMVTSDYTLRGLLNKVTYEVMIAAVNIYGMSEWSRSSLFSVTNNGELIILHCQQQLKQSFISDKLTENGATSVSIFILVRMLARENPDSNQFLPKIFSGIASVEKERQIQNIVGRN